MPKVSAFDDAQSTNPTQITRPAAGSTPRCPSWCRQDDVDCEGSVFHDSTAIRFDWVDGDVEPVACARSTSLTLRDVSFSDGRAHEPRVLIDGIADHAICTTTLGAYALAHALLLLLARAEQ